MRIVPPSPNDGQLPQRDPLHDFLGRGYADIVKDADQLRDHPLDGAKKELAIHGVRLYVTADATDPPVAAHLVHGNQDARNLKS